MVIIYLKKGKTEIVSFKNNGRKGLQKIHSASEQLFEWYC
ncbi:hypothetical protein J2Y40_003880 [Chryseobacterium sp. 2987]|nr:hypothetical protein [Chryseobacterium sp. 2987]